MSKRKLTSTNNLNRVKLKQVCGMLYAVDILAARWKLKILYVLEKRRLRFSEIKQLIPDITDRMLTLQLKEMERDGLVLRTVYPEVPVRVEYTLSNSTLALVPIWQQLEQWGVLHQQQQQEMMMQTVNL